MSDATLAAQLRGGCHFMQQAGRHFGLLRTNLNSPSIVHGRTAANRTMGAALGRWPSPHGQCHTAEPSYTRVNL